jgi:hypothetical protein
LWKQAVVKQRELASSEEGDEAIMRYSHCWRNGVAYGIGTKFSPLVWGSETQ